MLKTSLKVFIELEGKYSSLRDASFTSNLTGVKKFHIRLLKIVRGQGRGVIYFCGFEDFAHYLQICCMKLECSSGMGKALIQTLTLISPGVYISIQQNLISEN